MSKENAVVVPEAIVEKSTVIRGALSDKGEGILEMDVSVLETIMPEGVTLDTFKAHQKFEKELVAATTYAVGEAAEDIFKADKAVNSVGVDFKLGGDKFGVSCERTKEIRIPGREGQPDRKEQRAHYFTVKHKTGSTNNTGALSKVKQHFANKHK